MGLLSGFKKKEVEIAAPMNGRCVDIKKVPDPTFCEEILGKGVAIIPMDGKVYAPADGTITTVFPTGHAIGMTTDEGIEILVHVGIDTVCLKGEGFRIFAKEGQRVKQGELLIEADIGKIKESGYEVITPVIVCNSDEYAQINGTTEQEIRVGDVILKIKK